MLILCISSNILDAEQMKEDFSLALHIYTGFTENHDPHSWKLYLHSRVFPMTGFPRPSPPPNLTEYFKFN